LSQSLDPIDPRGAGRWDEGAIGVVHHFREMMNYTDYPPVKGKNEMI
jgi:hypothetical protein